MVKFLSFFLLLPFVAFNQNYTTYFTGNSVDKLTNPSGGVCLMGGATEDDNAMKWFLKMANGGDVLVLRTDNSSGYNNYFYATLGVPVNSVETIVCNNAAASNEPYLLQKIQQAEAIWFAGGDQWKYISYWRNTPVDSLINLAIKKRNIVIGGTSAGMAIQGKYYFSAQFGTVSSAAALLNPYNNLMTVDSNSFIRNNYLENVITDTHFDNPNRKGRLVTFLARVLVDYGVLGKAIACDEYTAVCIDSSGLAKVFGGYPSYDDNAYFIQTNCLFSNPNPEVCVAGTPLTWKLGNQAIKVYQVKGTASGSNTFNLNNWNGGTGGAWKNWSVSTGFFSELNANQPSCTLPIQLVDFNAYTRDNTVFVTWSAMLEENTATYQLEYSRDGYHFESIATIKPKGNGSSYAYQHVSTVGNAFYRLKIMDTNGVISFSSVRVLHIGTDNLFTVTPNPCNDFIKIHNLNHSILSMHLVSASGKLLTSFQPIGMNDRMSTSDLKSGLYLLKVIYTDGHLGFSKLIKH